MKAGVIMACLAVTACASSPPVEFQSQWPAKVMDYDDAVEAWTRRGSFRGTVDQHFTQLLDVYATFKSLPWRAAHARRHIELAKMSKAARDQLVRKHLKDDQEAYEVELLVATHDPKSNDLPKGERSVWRIVLADDRGNEIAPEKIVRDRRPPPEIEADFPDRTEFHRAYIARFPRTIDLLGPDARQFSLKMTSAQGGVELVWKRK